MVPIKENLVPKDKYAIKCPYTRTPTRVVIHNTANDAPAANEISYMRYNDLEISFHYAVDDVNIVQGIPENRNAWASGDGHGKGNMEGIHIEICYSKSGGKKFDKAEQNAAEFTASLLKKYGWGIDKVTKHQDYSGKYCPHRTLDMGWQRFLDMVQGYLDGEGATSSPSKSVDEIAQEVIAGKWGNGSERRERLTAAGYDYSTVQARVNEIMGGGSASATPAKSVDEVAQEVIAGKWGNGSDRKDRLTAAGYDYSQVQARVNELLGGSSDSSTSNSIAVGDTVRITCNTYSTGQSVPSWVKNTTHKVSQIKGDKALLGYPDGIASWVPLSGIVRA